MFWETDEGRAGNARNEKELNDIEFAELMDPFYSGVKAIGRGAGAIGGIFKEGAKKKNLPLASWIEGQLNKPAKDQLAVSDALTAPFIGREVSGTIRQPSGASDLYKAILGEEKRKEEKELGDKTASLLDSIIKASEA